MSWLLALRLSPKLAVKDDYFDFSIGLTELAAIEAYDLLVKTIGQDIFILEITKAQLASAVLESQVEPMSELILADMSNQRFDQLYLTHLANAKAQLGGGLAKTPSQAVFPRFVDNNIKIRAVANKNLMHKFGRPVLSEVLEIFASHSSRVFVISGTFLGLIREKDFIAHDYDIDLGIMEDEFDIDVLDLFRSHVDYRVSKLDFPCIRSVKIDGAVSYIKESKPSLVKIFHKSGVQIDLFTHFIEADIYWHGSSLHRWNNQAFGLVYREFLGMSVLSPADYDVYLTENYGDWRTPVKRFNCSTGTPNISISESCKTQCYFLKRAYLEVV